ncbi:hypothetical protein D0B54_14990 [Solimonas sp. K1W22B-7]|uniref:hypothetical protein n=1 Tax=Solimonas sp. K1W22B-7 TaxID=2303331 RepID=UPI000E3332D0|nr:hypothetical protein [Solimonas sp. K1W22B-7]AXQ29903.1 hypothetical protein D0B54_14990 [Solimonas sp. K1W22B-7]
MSKKVLFISNPAKYASYYMRAETIANRLRSEGYETEIFLWHGVRDAISLLRAIFRADAVISVKFFGRGMAPLLALSRRKMIYDCVDNFDFDGFAYRHGRRFISDYVVNNGLHRDFIAREVALPGQPVTVIEHHHSNFARQLRHAGTSKVIGYIGNRHDYGVGDGFSVWCEQRGLHLYVNHSTSLSNAEAISENLKLDVYFMLLPTAASSEKEAKRLGYVRDFKPAQKILLPFSLGIPTICAPYHAYFEAVRAAGYDVGDFLFVETEDELRSAIDRITDPANAAWLAELIERQKIVAENYHLDTIIEKYKKLIASADEG